MDSPEGALHNGGVHAVAGEGQNARVTAGGDQKVVIGGIVVLVAIVHLHGAYGGGQNGQAQLLAEEVKEVSAGRFSQMVSICTQISCHF